MERKQEKEMKIEQCIRQIFIVQLAAHAFIKK
jgi:hypothetical protein